MNLPRAPVDPSLFLPQPPRSPDLSSSIPFSSLSLSPTSPLSLVLSRPAARLLQAPTQSSLSNESLLQSSSPPPQLANFWHLRLPGTTHLTFLGGPGPPGSQKQSEAERHQADEQAQRVWTGASLHGPQTELSVRRRRLQPRQPSTAEQCPQTPAPAGAESRWSPSSIGTNR